MRKDTLLIYLALLLCMPLTAQPDEDAWYYGFRAGATYGAIGDIPVTIIPATFSAETYDAVTHPTPGFTGGIMLYHRFDESRFAIQPAIDFSTGGGSMAYADVNDLEYTIDLAYQYATLGTDLKVYPIGGLHAALGVELAFNVASDRIRYRSNMPELGPDLQIQESLREVLSGGTDVRLLAGIGYDFPFGLTVDLRYRRGLTDAVETLANGFGFIENPNKSTGLRATVGWLIEFPN